MLLSSADFSQGAVMPGELAFCLPDPASRVKTGPNLSPALSWSGLPPATRTLVLICVDTDVPTRADDVNKPDRVVPADLPRSGFYHWVMVDIPVSLDGLERGACSRGVTPRGKKSPPGPRGGRQGLNDYTGWFAADEDMAGQYFGYDGPCPPWNDSIVHHYRFRLYATSLERCPVEGAFTGKAVEQAIEGHVLDMDELTGVYSLNPDITA